MNSLFSQKNLKIDRNYIINDYNEFDNIVFNNQQTESIEIKCLSELSCDEIYTLLELALPHVRSIFIHEYFSQLDKLLAIQVWLHKYHSYIESFFGNSENKDEFIIVVKKIDSEFSASGSYKDLQTSYDETYYLKGCGGYDEFKKHQGKIINDPRILSAYYLSDIQKTDTILDVGAGRGELSYLFSQVCEKMVGLDYSEDAVNVAIDTYGTSSTLDFVQGDILEYQTKTLFDKIVATDVVEHIEQEPLEKAFENIHKLLKEDGMFVIHTSPNKLYYGTTYKKQREQALSLGLYLPENPRSCYEDLMHINEQTPAKLKRSLEKYFKKVFVWTANLSDIKGNFSKKPTKDDLSEHTSIFAIATDNLEIDTEYILSLITQPTINDAKLNVSIKTEVKNLTKQISESFNLKLAVSNQTNMNMKSFSPSPIHLCYHWKDKKSGEYIIYDGIRTPLTLPLMAYTTKHIYIDVVTPNRLGDYILELTMVQEGQFWFEERCEELPCTINVKVCK